MTDELDIEMFEHERGHSWRTTKNMPLYDVLAESRTPLANNVDD